jgi:TonB family protein
VVLAIAGCAAKPPTPSVDICRMPIELPARTVDEQVRERFTQEFNDEAAQNSSVPLSNTAVKLDKPPKVLFTVPPTYPAWAKRCGVEGRVILETVVDTDGDVVRATVVGNPPKILADAAVRSVRQWKFEPHTVDGRRVTVMFRQPLNYILSPPPQGAAQTTVGRRDKAPEIERKLVELSYMSAQMEAKLGPGVRVVNSSTTEQPLVAYANGIQTRVTAIGAQEGGAIVSRNLRVAVTMNSNGSVVRTFVMDSVDEDARTRADRTIRRAATLGPLPQLPGNEIKQIVFMLPFEAVDDPAPPGKP